jgi:diacylglycerol kinase family enzyme
MKRADVAKILPKAYSGAHVGTPGIVIGTTEEIRIKSPDPLYVHTDGEVETRAKEILVKVCPGRLTFAG